MEHRKAGKRALLAGYDIACAMACALVLLAATPTPAYAYVDPSVITYTIQAVAGVVVALSAVAGVAFRRTRRTLLRLLNIDENAGKTIEPSVRRTDGVEDGMDESLLPAQQQGAKPNKGATPLTWRHRFVFSLIIAAFSVFTLFVVAPLEMVAASEGSLVFHLGDVAAPVVLCACACTLALAAVLSVFRGTAFSVVLALVFSVGLGGWLQAMFMNGGLPSADGNAVIWSDFASITIISSIVWIAIIAGCLAASLLAKSRTRVIMSALAVCLLVVQGVGVASLFVKAGAPNEESSYVMTEEGLFTVSPDNNVIVFILDNYDTVFLQDALAADPALLDEMTGFVWFTDSVGSMIPTRYGVPYLLTGQFPHEDEKFSQFLEERYERSAFLSDLAATGSSVGIYSDTLGLQYVSDEQAADLVYRHTINFHQFATAPMDVGGTLSALATCALYRDMPWALKPAFWFYTDEINHAMVESDDKHGANEAPYTINDSRWFRQLRTNGLAFEEHEGTPGTTAFRFIHLLGAHYPYSIDEHGEDIGLDRSDRTRQAQGTMHMVSTYLHELKRLGVYDNATVILTADHGSWYITPEPLGEPATPIMLAKPPHADSAPIRISDAPVAAYDLLPTVLSAAGADASAYGKTLFELDAQGPVSRMRTYLMTSSDGAHDQQIIEYAIDGNALDLENWHLTGTVWDAHA